MGKVKAKSGAFRVPNRQSHARISFLYQAATYLTKIPQTADTKTINQVTENVEQGHSLQKEPPVDISIDRNINRTASDFALSQYYSSQIGTIARKAQFKIAPSLKRSICKGCSVILVPGSTSTTTIENLSCNASKPWADVLLISCQLCGMEKRLPLQPKGDRRSKKLRHVVIAEPRNKAA